MFDEDNEEMDIDKDVDSIIFQIKNQGKAIKTVEKDRPELSKEDIEKFIIDNASTVINDSIEMIQEVKDIVVSSGDSKSIEAVAELVKAVTGAIDSLSKLKLSDDKIKSQKELKQMDIDAKVNLGMDVPAGSVGILMSREDLFKQIKELHNKPENDEKHKAIDV